MSGGGNKNNTVKYVGLGCLALTILCCIPGLVASLVFGKKGIASGGDSTSTTLSAHFSPDPTVIEGTAGGAQPLSTLVERCRGYAASSTVPQYTVNLTENISRLRIMVHGMSVSDSSSSCDTTVAIRSSSGVILCDDDSDGHDPVVDEEFAAGRYEIFVGTFSANTSCRYKLGFSTNASQMPSTLP